MNNKKKAIIASFLTTSLFISGCSNISDDDVEKAKKENKELIDNFTVAPINSTTLKDENGLQYTISIDTNGYKVARYKDKRFVRFALDDKGNIKYIEGDKNIIPLIAKGYLASIGYIDPTVVQVEDDFFINQSSTRINPSTTSSPHYIPFMMNYWGNTSMFTPSATSSVARGFSVVPPTSANVARGFGSAGARSSAS